MTVTIVQIVGALALLFIGGDVLVRGASGLALRLGVSALAVGLTVVALGTSTPELVVSIDAALSDANDISIGNVVGSNIANIALILGLAAVIRPITSQAKIVRFDAPLMVGVSVLLLAMLADRVISRVDGLVLVLGLTSYVVFTLWQAKREVVPVQEELRSVVQVVPPRILVRVLQIVAGLGLLVGGGHFLVAAAVRLATGVGISEAAIGLTIVAVGTSLPELAASVVAAIRGHGDIAIGNVVGSNIFNILGILGVTALIRPLELGGVRWVDLGVMVLLAIVLVPLLLTRSRLDRLEGALLLAAFGFYTAHVLAA